VTGHRSFVTLSDIVPIPQRWLWENRIPLGAITTLVGDPGTGKSSLSMDIAARTTTARPMPNETSGHDPAGVVILQGEDTNTTVRRSIDAAGGDPSRILLLSSEADGSLSESLLPECIPSIHSAVDQIGARLVVIDPLNAFVRTSTTNDQAVRRAIGPLARLAEEREVAVVLISHLSKSGSQPALYRAAGSIAIVGLSRSVLVAAPEPACDVPFRCVLASVKNNQAAAESLSYRTRLTEGGRWRNRG
jgi:RecA-family ATPase